MSEEIEKSNLVNPDAIYQKKDFKIDKSYWKKMIKKYGYVTYLEETTEEAEFEIIETKQLPENKTTKL